MRRGESNLSTLLNFPFQTGSGIASLENRLIFSNLCAFIHVFVNAASTTDTLTKKQNSNASDTNKSFNIIHISLLKDSSQASCFVYFNHIFNFLSAYRAQSTFMIFNNNSTFEAHAHVSTGVQHSIHRSFIAHSAFTGFTLSTRVHGSFGGCGKRFDVCGVLLFRHGHR